MARFRLVLNGLYFSIISAILISASAEESRNRTKTTTSLPLSSSATSTTQAPVRRTRGTTSTTEQAQASTTLTPSTSTVLTAAPSAPVTNVEVPPTLTDFIITMMKRFGAAKAVEAFQSLDQLPLGLIMKILLVEMDKQLAADIVAMQRYAQSTDKALILMIGRIVGGDKNVPKEIFSMDQKLMKFPWWMRIRQRMFNNLEKYVAAYSLVPVAAKSAITGGSDGAGRSSSRSKLLNTGLESFIQGPQPDLAIAVAASATESYSSVGSTSASASKTILQEVPPVPVPDSAPAASEPATTTAPVRVSLLNPIQQQQIYETLALAQAAAGANSQVQQLLQLQQLQQLQQQQQQQQQATNINPFLQLFG